MNIVAINGSPRKGWNTHLLLEEAIKGAASHGAETEIIHLYDLTFKGCVSCFGCKLKDGKSYGQCVVSDALKPVLRKIEGCDGLIIGSPIYWGEVTASTRAFLERFLFQYLSYNKERQSLLQKRIRTAFIFTGNVPEDHLEPIGYVAKFEGYKQLFNRFVGETQTMVATETLQVENYAKYGMTMFDESERKKRREEIFPIDCQKAFNMGANLAMEATHK